MPTDRTIIKNVWINYLSYAARPGKELTGAQFLGFGYIQDGT
ncbi:MAG: hypothetical protein SCH66_13015 [Methanolobus sp.]|nr:hypothetical protein [Methanolobus sp.]